MADGLSQHVSESDRGAPPSPAVDPQGQPGSGTCSGGLSETGPSVYAALFLFVVWFLVVGTAQCGSVPDEGGPDGTAEVR